MAEGREQVLGDFGAAIESIGLALALLGAAYEELDERAGDKFMRIITKVNSLLPVPAITAMNKAVAIDKQDEATVAKQFLQSRGLVASG